MDNFEKKLDDKIKVFLEASQVSDDMYRRYVQYVGELDALPKDQIASSTVKYGPDNSDIHDQFGRVKPFSQWPTKKSREKSAKVWVDYNTRLQMAQASDEIENPVHDPNFLSQLLDTCVRTSMGLGLDKQTAFRHCSRQVDKFEGAIRDVVADRGLPAKQAKEFIDGLLKGMGAGKQLEIKDLSIEDQQFIQDLKDSLTYVPKSEGIVRENLDDNDTFNDCFFHGCNSDEFHEAHLQAALTAQSAWERLKEELTSKSDIASLRYEARQEINLMLSATFNEAFADAMDMQGYVRKGDVYVKGGSVKEDVDSDDQFAPDCHYYNCDKRPDSPEFHRAHTTAFDTVLKNYPGERKMAEAYAAEMAKFGYFQTKPNGFFKMPGSGDWVKKEQPAVKEDLDAKDDFGEQLYSSIEGYCVSDDFMDEATLKGVLEKYIQSRMLPEHGFEDPKLTKGKPLYGHYDKPREQDIDWSNRRQERLNNITHKGMELPDDPVISGWSVVISDARIPDTEVRKDPFRYSAHYKNFKEKVPVNVDGVIFVPIALHGPSNQ